MSFSFDIATDAPEFDSQAGGGNWGPLENGRYTIEIGEVIYRANKKGNGHLLEFKTEVVVGDRSGKFLTFYLNVDNPSEKAVEISKIELARILDAVSMKGFRDPVELEGKRLDVDVEKTPDTGYGEGNDVKRYYPATSGSSAAPGAAAPMHHQAPTTPVATNTSEKMPWEK